MKSKLENVVEQLSCLLRCEWGLTKRAVRILYSGLFVACATNTAAVLYWNVMTANKDFELSAQNIVDVSACL